MPPDTIADAVLAREDVARFLEGSHGVKGAAALAIPTTTLVAQPVLRKRIRRSFKGWVNACSAGPANPRRGWHVDFSVMRLRRNNDARTKSHTPA